MTPGRWMGERGCLALSVSQIHLVYMDTCARSYIYISHPNTHMQPAVSLWLSLSSWNLLSESGVAWLLKFPHGSISGYSSYSTQLPTNTKIVSPLSAKSSWQACHDEIESCIWHLYVSGFQLGQPQVPHFSLASKSLSKLQPIPTLFLLHRLHVACYAATSSAVIHLS